MPRKSIPINYTEEEAPRRFEAAAPESDQYTEEETVARREAMLKRMFSTPPQHRTAKGDKANPQKKRGRPKKAGAKASQWESAGNPKKSP